MKRTYYKSGDWNALCKVCNTCNTPKSLNEYHKHSGAKDGYRPQCKICKNKVAALYRKNNKGSIAQKTKLWQQANRDRCNKAVRKWRKNNLAYDAHRASFYRASKLNATPKWADLIRIKEYYDKASAVQLAVDHIVPLNSKLVCGLHCEDNLQLLPMAVNSAKGNRYWEGM